jgi:hypothetical protein
MVAEHPLVYFFASTCLLCRGVKQELVAVGAGRLRLCLLQFFVSFINTVCGCTGCMAASFPVVSSIGRR